MESLVLLAIGRDRPGLVDLLASTVAAHQGSWLESRFVRLAGSFTGLVRVRVPAERVDALTASASALAAEGLEVTVRRAADPTDDDPVAAGARASLVLRLVGADRPGIVKAVSACIARHGGNVVELHTDITSAPMSGEPLFEARAHLRLDPANAAALETDLEAIAADLMVDLDREASAAETDAAPARS